jgi:signal transduction histidine kinase
MDEQVKILVVDDLPEKLLAYRTVLDELGQTLVLASSGQEALREALRHEFAVILLDVNLPDIDGLETAELLRKHPVTRHTPIIFLSAFADEPQMKRGYALGAVDFIQSPSVPEVVRSKVKVFVELALMQRRARAMEDERLALFQVEAEKRAAEEANRRKDEFLAMLSHELRNPLAPLRNVVEILRRAPVTDATVSWAREVLERQVVNLSLLVDDLLDVSRVAQGKVKLQKEPAELAKIISNAVEIARPLMRSRRHQVMVSMPPAPVWVLADFGRLTQVFANLLTNAAKYTPEGGQIELSATTLDGKVEVAVHDNGIGIEAELLPRIFDLFTQADRSLGRSEGGLGIGLTVVKRLVELHDGEIAAQSGGADKGSVFTVVLPRINYVYDAAHKAVADPALLEECARRRVLVVDDNPDIAGSVARYLRMLGHEVRTASDGAQAIEKAEALDAEVVVLDIGLPKLNGYEVARRLRRSAKFADTLMIALTGYGRHEDQALSAKAGFHHHFVKPADPRAIQAIIAKWTPKPSLPMGLAPRSDAAHP